MPERKLFSRPGLTHSGQVIQFSKLLSTRIVIGEPALVRVRLGRKFLRWAGRELVVEAGQTVALAVQQTFDVINEPDAVAGIYQADWLMLEAAPVAQFAERYGVADTVTDAFVVDASADWEAAFERAQQAVRDGVPDVVSAARLDELLAWLADAGAGFAPYEAVGLVRQIRKTIAADATYGWTTERIAVRFDMSVATLRRRLAAEQTSFQRLLTDVRMMRALTLLQVTEWPVSQIAYAVGYESPSRFGARFRQRFGFAPSQVRQQADAAKVEVRHQRLFSVGSR